MIDLEDYRLRRPPIPPFARALPSPPKRHTNAPRRSASMRTGIELQTRVPSRQELWLTLRAPLLALVVVAVIEALAGTPLDVPDPGPVLLVFVIFAAYTWRLRDGIAAGAVALL